MRLYQPNLNAERRDDSHSFVFVIRRSLWIALVVALSVIAALAQTEPAAKPVVDEPSSDKPSVQDPNINRTDRVSALRAQIAEAKTEADRVRLRRTLVEYLVALNKKSEAIDELRAMSAEDRLDPIGFYNIGNALARVGDIDSAIATYRKAIKQRHGNYARALNNLGVLLLRQGRWGEAEEALISASKLEDYRYSEASYNLGRLYAMRGEDYLAIREWSRALIAQPDHVDAAIALARAYAEDGKQERGLALLDGFISRRGSTTEIANARREILAGEGAGAERLSTTKVIVASASEGKSSTRESTTSKSSNAKSGKSAAAPRHLSLDQSSYDLLQRARSAVEEGRNEEAASFYRKVLSRNDGFFPPANLEMSFVLSALKRNAEAASTLTTLVEREGARYPIAYYHLGRQYEALGQLSNAADAFQKAAAAFGDSNPQFLLDLSRVREKENNFVAAVAAFENYIRISKALGNVPDWSAERLAQLRQKSATSSQNTAPVK